MNTRDNRLNYFDQIALELLSVTDRNQLIQAVVLYEHPVDLEGLRSFHRRLGAGLIGRLAERSALPFARPRWVSVPGPAAEISIAEKASPREELMDWVEEQARRPIDPVKGPGWAMAVLPLSDGATAVSVVFSHCLLDGGGLIVTVHNAVTGSAADFGYPLSQSRSRAAGLIADLRDTVREIPEGLRALTALAKVVAEKRRNGARSAAPEVLDDPALDRVIDIPSVIATVDTAAWDARAEALGGNTYALVAGVTARLAEHLGRRRESDGTVTLSIAGNGRTSADDDRAQAMTFANAVLDPAEVTTNLSPARDLIRAAREQAKGQPDPTSKLYPLVAWSPRRTATAVVALMFSYGDSLPSSCSNLGEIPGYFANLDGTAAEYVVARAVDKNVTLRDLHRSHGTLVVVSGRINGRIWIAVEAYELGADNSRSRLRSIVEQTLSEFGVDGATYL